MGVLGMLKLIVVRSIEASLIIALILYMPSLPPDTTFTAVSSTTPALLFEGKLALNGRLNNVEHWHDGELKGAEAFAVHKGELYTSLQGGDVVKLVGNHITPIAKFGKPCKGLWQESTCGRPLGLRFDKNGALIVADAYYGIYKVDVATGDHVRLISMNEEIDGKKPKIFNSVAIASNGDIYWTDSSTDFSLQDGVFAMIGDPTGRLIHYNANTRKNTVLLNKINFANGVLLSDDEDYILVSETGQSRILRYYLKGTKKGQKDVFIDGLPGLPDNLQSDGQGGVLVPLVMARDAANPNLFQILGPFPLVRKFIARILGLVEVAFKTIDQIYPNEICQRAVHAVGHFETGSKLVNPKRSTLLQISKSGEIIDCLHGTVNLTGISEVIVHNGYLYLGSPFNDYIGRIPLAMAGLGHLKPTVSQSATASQQQQQSSPPSAKTRPTQKPTAESPRTVPPTQAPKAQPTTKKPSTTTTTKPPTTTAPPTKAPTTQPPKASPPTQAPKAVPPSQASKIPPTQAPKTQPPKTQPPPTQAPKQTPPPQKQTPPPPVKQQTPPTAKPQARAVPLSDGPKSESVRTP